MVRHLILNFLLSTSFCVLANVVTGERTCSCGFYDTSTAQLYTDSVIVYFNETQNLPSDFVAEDYHQKYEKDWNAVFRQGADPSNLQIIDDDSLQLFVSPPSRDHLVKGGSIRTARRDIHHGSFRAFIKSPRREAGGSAMTMMWQYNETEVTELSVMNTNDPDHAWVGTFVNAEFTERDLGLNFSTALEQSSLNRNYTVLGGNLQNGSIDPWEYTEYRIDWTRDYVNFYVGGNLTRSVLHENNTAMPSVPAPFHFKHWSTGNRFSMEGPPMTRSVANIGWIRMFFNSTSISEEARQDFVTRCSVTLACSMDDISLRGSTPYTEQATLKWKQKNDKDIKRMPALWISVICISFSSVLLLHAFIRRAPWRKRVTSAVDDHVSIKAHNHVETHHFGPTEYAHSSTSQSTPAPSDLQRTSSVYGNNSKDDLTIERVEPSPGTSEWGGSTHRASSRAASLRFDNRGTTPRLLVPFITTVEEQPVPAGSQVHLGKHGSSVSIGPSERTLAVNPAQDPEAKVQMTTVTESALPAPRMTAHPPPPRERIEYLAGLVALCAVLVTVMHFGLTFVPAMIIPGAPVHYKSEVWAQKVIAPFILNQMWLGVFFTTSVRFLVAGYLKRGNMETIAKAAVRRTPRLMIPVASIAMLEYFLVDCGATKYLQYIPSITWSTWPYVTRFPTAGHFISAVLELIFLIPNAVPQITFHYCTGVLWTIAVQLQGTWLVLCGVIVVYEIKTPWKRMAYYTFCVINHWYAQSWGSYLWLGLLLTDLDVTYKYKQYLHSRPWVYYALITFLWLCVAAGFSANVIPNWLEINISTWEHNIHPDPSTGEPLWNTVNAGYPAYYVPRLNGLLFAAGMQALVELSPAVQWVLSLPFLLVLFPHIFTIYLLHGLVFWSWGSWLMVFLANRGFGYGVNVTIVGVTSYVVLFAILPIITPIIEALGKDITALVWMSATEKPPPRRRTLFPFPEDLFKRRAAGDVEAAATSLESSVEGSSGRTTPSEKGKSKEKVKEIDQFEPGLKRQGEGQLRSAWD